MDRYDVNKLKDTNICGSFKKTLQETMNSLNINQEETIDIKWKVIMGAMKTLIDTVIGKQKRNGGSIIPARKHLIEGKKPGLNCSTTPLIERR